jgi:acylphosphatase
MSAAVVRHVIVRGRVQGVGFRAFVEDEAAQRRLAGWVRNRRDGSVEAVLSGPVAQVDSMLAALRQGPPAARVDAVQVSEAGAAELAQRLPGDAFSVLRTL